MKVKLVRLDGEEPEEIYLPVGETVIGRVPLMKCTDRKVSRKHALIRVSKDGRVELISTSSNPCYYGVKKKIVKKSKVEIKNRDQFSFLPDTYTYRVIIEIDQSSDSVAKTDKIGSCSKTTTSAPWSHPDTTSSNTTVDKDVTDNRSEVSQSSEPGVELTRKCASTEIGGIAPGTSRDVTECPSTEPSVDKLDKSPSAVKKWTAPLPSWMLKSAQKRKEGEPSSQKSPAKKLKTEERSDSAKSEDVLRLHPLSDDESGGELPGVDSKKAGSETGERDVDRDSSDDNRSYQSGEGSATKSRDGSDRSKESSAARSHQSDRSKESSTARSHQSDRSKGSSTANSVKPVSSTHQDIQVDVIIPGQSPTPGVIRVPCKYGSACYRKSVQHRLDYSHPGDADYQPRNRPGCPFGTASYRKTPQRGEGYERERKKSELDLDADAVDDNGGSEEDDPFEDADSSDEYYPNDSGSDNSASEGVSESELDALREEARQHGASGKRKK